MYAVNLLHIFSVTRAFLPSMIERHRAPSSTSTRSRPCAGSRGEPVYAAMKAAAAHFTTSLAVTVGRHGIRVNGIGPLTQTPQVDYLHGYEDLGHLWGFVGRRSAVSVGPRTRPGSRCSSRRTCRRSSPATNVPVDGGTKAAGGWYFSPQEGRFVNARSTSGRVAKRRGTRGRRLAADQPPKIAGSAPA